MIILGIDPALGTAGWGIVAAEGNRLSHIANGQIATTTKATLPERLVELDRALTDIIHAHRPDAAAVEEVFVNANPQSTLKLGQARGAILLSPPLRFTTPEQLGGLAVFMCSPAGDNVCGVAWNVDGGWVAQ